MAILGMAAADLLNSLKVDPDVMRNKAALVQEKIRDMQTAFESLENTVRKTQNYWIGEAGDAHREMFFKSEDDREEIFKRLMEDVTDLNQMADVYSTTEREVKEISEELPSDVII